MINFKKAFQPLLIIIFTKLQTTIIVIMQEVKKSNISITKNHQSHEVQLREWNNLNNKTSIYCDLASPDLICTKLIKIRKTRGLLQRGQVFLNITIH